VLNIKTDFGAVGDGVADDTLAIQNALDAAWASGGEVIIAPKGTYRVTSTLNMSGIGTSLKGEGSGDKVTPFGAGPVGPTTIMVDHTSGPGVRIKQYNCSISGIRIDSSPSRKAGATAIANTGLRVEADDVSAARTSGTTINDVYCVGHPGDGILICGEMTNSRISDSGATNCKAHGICIDGGYRTSRVFKHRPGHVKIDMCRASRCYGNALVIGSPNDDAPGLATLPYRIEVNNFESFYIASDASIRYGKDAVWAFGENMVFSLCAFGGHDVDATPRIHDGIYVAGRAIRLIACRYIETLRAAVIGSRTNLPSRDIVIDGTVVSHIGAAMNPAVVITTGAKGIKIRSQQQASEVTTWATGTAAVLELDITQD